MSVHGIGDCGPAGYPHAANKANAQQTQPAASQESTLGAASEDTSVEQQFLDYMKKSPAQKMIDAWLKAHHLTEKDLDEMTPEKREATLQQMASDIKNEMKQKIGANLDSKAGVLV